MPPAASKRQTVKPGNVTTLSSWVARWPNAGNLGFDPETREPAIFAADGGAQVAKIPWRREADILTVLSTPEKWSPELVTAARTRMTQYKEQKTTIAAAVSEQLRVAEATLIAAWKAYDSADAVTRPMLRRNIIVAERELFEIEKTGALPGRTTRTNAGVYVPTLPIDKRGISAHL